MSGKSTVRQANYYPFSSHSDSLGIRYCGVWVRARSKAHQAISYWPRDQNLLDKYDLKPNDAMLSDKSHHPLFDELICNHSAQMLAGGGCQNTARGAQVRPGN